MRPVDPPKKNQKKSLLKKVHFTGTRSGLLQPPTTKAPRPDVLSRCPAGAAVRPPARGRRRDAERAAQSEKEAPPAEVLREGNPGLQGGSFFHRGLGFPMVFPMVLNFPSGGFAE